MARTPLFSMLRRALSLADTAESLNVSTSEVMERDAEARVSRRQLLGGVGAAAAAAALQGCAPESVTGTAVSEARVSMRVVVVGAGLAGLAAAYRLAQRGFNPVVYDANDRAGGRCFSLRGRFATKSELGGEVIDTGHASIQALATELGLTLLDQVGAAASLEQERYHLLGQPWSLAQIVDAYRPVSAILREDFRSQGSSRYATYNDFTPASQALDRLSLDAWMDRIGLRGPLRALLDVAYTSEYGREVSEQSYLNLLYLINRKAEPFEIFGESDERYTILEGNDALVTGMLRAIPAPVRLGHALESVRARADGALQATFRAGGRSVEVTADKLVLALPFTQLRRCDLRVELPAAKLRSIRGLPYGTNAKVMIGTRTRPWALAGASGLSFHDRVFHESWDSARGYPTQAGVMTSFTGGRLGVAVGEDSAQQQGDRFARELDVLFPGVAAAYTGNAVRFHWPSARWFDGSYGCYEPGAYTSYVGSEAEPVGNLHFCGEHTSTEAQGYLEGAVESGERVAGEIRQAVR